jgi:hypothetical protein
MSVKTALKNAGVMTVVIFFISICLLMVMINGQIGRRIAEICMPFAFFGINLALYGITRRLKSSKSVAVIMTAANIIVLAGYVVLLRFVLQ